ncbi:MAG: urease accessory UreF family protein [Elainellaceae cyanobacterium]
MAEPPAADASGLMQLATLLQQADSFFPSGAVAFSWGLESLVNEQQIQTAVQLEQLIAQHLYNRWASSDRAFMIAAYEAENNLAAIQSIDQLQDCMTLAREWREGSQRMGAALLKVHAQLGTRNAKSYRMLVLAHQAPGHAAIVQGMIGRSLQLSAEQLQLLAAHTLCVNLLSAAIRLSVIGHLDSQRILNRLRSAIANILLEPVPPLHATFTAMPMVDVAAMRHETQLSRLFSN